MINCRNCINWVDENLHQIEQDKGGEPHIFLGCRIFGYVENNTALESCPHYHQSENLYTLCSTCRTTVPKVCVSLGECVNCTDTDLFCVDNCIGGEARKYCTHFVRLHSEGVHLIYENRTFDLFPTLGMPGQKQPENLREAEQSREKQEPFSVKPKKKDT